MSIVSTLNILLEVNLVLIIAHISELWIPEKQTELIG